VSGAGRVEGLALHTADEEAVHLIVPGVQQDRPAVTGKNSGRRACHPLMLDKGLIRQCRPHAGHVDEARP
jgi:hypothetical protein